MLFAMTSRASSDASQLQPLSKRFAAAREIGGGGMAIVYEVLDTTTGRRLALKRPRRQEDAEQERRMYELFAREYMTLAQLAHPRIVAVYDYGVDELGPYYTMELLDGGDLQEVVPAEFSRVCSIARDVCSALSILHARRAVHRDISPRNVRCTATGTAKLIDFGAMTSMGPAKELVGTPAYCAPEMLNNQSLDARTDLYALGATLYYVVTGRHAYPARDFSSLTGAWRFGFPRPSELVAGIPPALDALIVDLLQLDPNARPGSASEVMARLAVIEGRAVDEQLVVAQAYLSAPELVGREAERARLSERMNRERGSVTLIEGPSGVGRSRLLDAALLQSKLAGKLVLRAGADNAFEGAYGAVRALVRQLSQLAPGAFREVVSDALPTDAGRELSRWTDAAAVRHAPSNPSAELQAATRQLFAGIAQRTPLVLGVDDLHRLDEPSVSVFALVAQDVRRARVTLFATWIPEAPRAGSALQLFADAASKVELQNLSHTDVRAMLCSVFGESPQLDALVHRVFAITSGNPRGVMQLAQYLVDDGVARYHAGAWTLPDRLDVINLPTSVNQLLGLRVENLTVTQRALGAAFALCPGQSFSFEESAELTGQSDTTQSLLDVERLVQTDIVRPFDERYRLADRAWVNTLLHGVTPPERCGLHLRLARVFELRGGEEFRVAQHLLRAGDHSRALDLLVAHALASQSETDGNPDAFNRLVRTLPPDWEQTYDEALQLCRDLRRPKREAYAIRRRLSGLLAVAGLHGRQHMIDLVRTLQRDSGLDDWAALDPSLPPHERLTVAIERAQSRFIAASEHERVLDPIASMRGLVRSVSDSLGLTASRLDLDAIRALPSMEPFAAISRAPFVIQKLVDGVAARLSGRLERARDTYAMLLELTGGADRGGLPESQHRAVRALVGNAVGMIEASMGLASSLEYANALDADPLFRMNAVTIRMTYELWQGHVMEADRARRKIDLLRIESGSRQPLEHSYLVWQVTAYASMDDLTRLKRCSDEIGPVAEQHRGWQPVAAFARAAYQRALGDLESARDLVTRTLASVRAGDHMLWAHLAGLHVGVVQEQGFATEAVALAARYLELAEDAELGLGINRILEPLAIAQAKCGVSDALATAERALERLRALGATGLNIGIACETCARVALERGDQAAYDTYSAMCSDEFLRSGNPALSARYQRLRRAAQQKSLVTLPPIADRGAQQSAARSSAFRAQVATGRTLADRARVALALLSEESGAREGYLYHLGAEGLQLVASIGVEQPPSPGLDAIVREYVLGQTQAGESTTGEDTSVARTDWTVIGEATYRPVLLSHYFDDGFAITGIAVFNVQSDDSFTYPRAAALLLSQLAVEMGDVTSIVVSE
jgi:hypothetical protein